MLINKNWHQYFVHTIEYYEYLLGDLGYMGKDMFVMCCVGKHEMTFEVDLDAIKVYNKMHVGFLN
jgi:hypothetical protein